ncbi:MAG: bacillithiol biosynthesis cysteine-adding enzyme BshC [Chitinophagaceae bacterium]|nr:bacillithiol biosynthesis cysteine-adding enzyme BshC [Chitinophagaceae bacterium]
MKFQKASIPYADTGFFSPLVIDYLAQDDQLKSFVQDFPSVKAIGEQIKRKQEQPVDRAVLVKALNKQYSAVAPGDPVKRNIDALASSKTFTICTAHQPNIFTGYLYFIYKIVHAIRLSQECARHYPDYQFVPVYYMGSEDNDLDEIGALYYGGQSYQWATEQTGACGRMSTRDLTGIRDEIIRTLNDQLPREKEMIQLLRHAYNGTHTLAQATRIFVHALFQQYGLIIIDGDDPELKANFRPVLQDELLHQTSARIVGEQIEKLKLHYNAQANPRDLNLFYLKEGLRERIEKDGEGWKVVNTNVHFVRQDIDQMISEHPEYFSPNVILRPLYQEAILPNIAFIGGGGELAYWLEMKTLFEHYGVVYPLLFLRNSLLVIPEKEAELQGKAGLEIKDLFKASLQLGNEIIQNDASLKKLQDIDLQLVKAYDLIIALASESGLNLAESMQAHRAKALKIQTQIAGKFRNALRKKEHIQLERIEKLKSRLFPGGNLQERKENYLTFFKWYGEDFIESLVKLQEGFGTEFMVLTESRDSVIDSK